MVRPPQRAQHQSRLRAVSHKMVPAAVRMASSAKALDLAIAVAPLGTAAALRRIAAQAASRLSELARLAAATCLLMGHVAEAKGILA